MSHHQCTTKESKYQRLSHEKRIKIESFCKAGWSQGRIASEIGISKSTVCRELRRGKATQAREVKIKPTFENHYESGVRREYFTVYVADLGQAHADRNVEARLKRCQVAFEKGYADFIDSQILGSNKTVSIYTANIRAKEAGFKTVCDRTLYAWVHKGLLGVSKMDLLLTVQRKPSGKGKSTENKKIYGDSIELRPKEANERTEFGHFEGDSIVGANHKGHIITLVERQLRIGFMFKFDEMRAENIAAVKEILKNRYGQDFYKIFRSITFDNGTEFSNNIQDEQLRIYYAHPYSSFERGSNENYNGIVRRYIKKGADVTALTDSDIERINHSINSLPRKLLGGKTALQAFKDKVAKLCGKTLQIA